MFRDVTTENRKVHRRRTVNISYRLYVGCNAFICRQRVGQEGILLSAKTAVHSNRKLPSHINAPRDGCALCSLTPDHFHDCDSDYYWLCPDNVACCTWGNIMSIEGDISLYCKIFTSERRQATAEKHNFYVNFFCHIKI